MEGQCLVRASDRSPVSLTYSLNHNQTIITAIIMKATIAAVCNLRKWSRRSCNTGRAAHPPFYMHPLAFLCVGQEKKEGGYERR